MRAMRINWKEIKHRMIERGIRSQAQLARDTGVHQNTLQKDGPFLSTTLDRIADLLGCDPRELIMLEDTPEPPSEPVKRTFAAPRARVAMPAPGNISPAEAERRAALLAQATARGKTRPGQK